MKPWQLCLLMALAFLLLPVIAYYVYQGWVLLILTAVEVFS